MKKAFLLAAVLLFSALAFSQNVRPIVSDIKTELVSSARVKISWKLPAPTIDEDFRVKGLLVFRSTQPFAGISQLSSDPIASLDAETTEYTDILKNYREQYYAVIATTSSGRYDIILPSINATVNGIRAKNSAKTTEIPEKKEEEKFYVTGQKREMPLPYLDYLDGTGKKPAEFSEEVMENWKKLAAGYENQKHEVMPPHFFDEDLYSPDGGDDYFLFEILKKTFAKKKYDEYLKECKKLLGVNRSESVVARATFYKGEALYFTGDMEKAIMTFLEVEPTYPALCKKWIVSALNFMKVE